MTHSARRIAACLVASLLAGGAASCRSAGSAERELKATSGDAADLVAMASSNPERALALVAASIAEGKPLVESEKVTESSLAELGRRFRSHAEKGEWAAALTLYRDIRAVSGDRTQANDILREWSEANLMERQAEALASSGDSGRALLWYQRSFAASQPRKPSVEKAWRLAVDSGDPSAQRALLGVAKEAGAAGGQELKALEEHKPPFKDMMKGVCTIWVNKGLKVESGVAVPDRVIGSGFFIDRRGYLLTNYHVISSEVDPKYEGYSRLFVRLSGMKDERIPAKVIGWDRNLDLALLKTSVTPEFVFSVSPGKVFSPGDRIYAIGSPVGLENTITSGIVSATGRDIMSMGEAIQVDVAVNPGNSGGPLLDENGDLAGVVFAGLLSFQGLNFAIPADWVAAALDTLYAGGEAAYAFSGMSTLTDGDALRIVYPLFASPAREYGIRSGDVLKSIDGKPFTDFMAASAYVISREPGCLVRVEVEREGKSLSYLLPLAKRPYNPLDGAIGKDPIEKLFAPLFGMDVELTSKGFFSIDYRILKVYKGKIADEAGLSESDPFSLQGWKYLKEEKAVVLELYVKRRKQGFLETIIQIPASIEGVPFL